MIIPEGKSEMVSKARDEIKEIEEKYEKVSSLRVSDTI